MPGNDGVAPGIGRVVVALIQRISDDRPQAAGYSFAQQRRFAKAGWGGDEGQFAVQPRVQPLDQARGRDEFSPDGRGCRLWFAGSVRRRAGGTKTAHLSIG
jgi:hypothetical protein